MLMSRVFKSCGWMHLYPLRLKTLPQIAYTLLIASHFFFNLRIYTLMYQVIWYLLFVLTMVHKM